jgi:hypothetical protein
MNKKNFTIFLILIFTLLLFGQDKKVKGGNPNAIEGGGGGGGDPCAGCIGSYCSGNGLCTFSCVNNSCVSNCSCSKSCGANCCSDSDCPASGSCNYGAWQDIGCGQSGGGVTCASTQMLQKRVSSNSSYTRNYCEDYTCKTKTVSCPDQYQCVNRTTCGANVEINFSKLEVSPNENVTTTIVIDAGSYGICEDGLAIKLNGATVPTTTWNITPSGDYSMYSTCKWFTGDNCYWTTPFCSYYRMDCNGCVWNGREMYWHYYKKKTFTKVFSFAAPGTYSFSVTARFTSNQDSGYYSTTSQSIIVKPVYGTTAGSSSTLDISWSQDVILGNPSSQTVIDKSGVVLGSENENVIIQGEVNLVAYANKIYPIRLIYGKELRLSQGAKILLPDPKTSPSLIGGAYIIKKGKTDPYATNTPASICNPNYTGRPYIYCDIGKICQNGSCVNYTPVQ